MSVADTLPWHEGEEGQGSWKRKLEDAHFYYFTHVVNQNINSKCYCKGGRGKPGWIQPSAHAKSFKTSSSDSHSCTCLCFPWITFFQSHSQVRADLHKPQLVISSASAALSVFDISSPKCLPSHSGSPPTSAVPDFVADLGEEEEQPHQHTETAQQSETTTSKTSSEENAQIQVKINHV